MKLQPKRNNMYQLVYWGDPGSLTSDALDTTSLFFQVLWPQRRNQADPLRQEMLKHKMWTHL